MKNEYVAKFWQKWSIAVKIIPILLLVLILKTLSHKFGFEVIALNAIFTSLVGGTIFLLGFLISGVLSDYKESEKLPGELAASLESLHDEAHTMISVKNSKAAKDFLEYHKSFMQLLNDWLYKKEKTSAILKSVSKMNAFFIEMEKEGVQAGFIIRMKTEQNNLRKMIIRIHTIRDTDFIASGYAIVEALGVSIAVAMILIKMDKFYESLIFTMLVTFLISYMFFLIKDLDNPFDYSVHGESGTEVSLKPIHDLEKRLKENR